MRNLSRHAVYTTIAPERLDAAGRGADVSEPLTEKRRWVSAKALLDNADPDEDVPILFSDSRDCSELVRWAVLREIKIGPGQISTFRFANLTLLRRHSTQELVLRKTGKRIAPGFIRPYALCETPGFLQDPPTTVSRREIGRAVERCCHCGEISASENRPVCVACERKGARAVFCRYGHERCFQGHFASHPGRKSYRVKTENIDYSQSGESRGPKRDVLGGLITLSRATPPQEAQSPLKTTSFPAIPSLSLAKQSKAAIEALVEGARGRVEANRYERNPKARRRCIEHYGATCFVCGFTFEKTYGPLADGFIHVHHIRPVATVGKRYVVDPIADLRPLCPNCHAVVHLQEPAIKLDDLADLLRWRAR